MLKKMKVFVGALALIFNLAPLATAESSTPTNDEIAKELANPNTALTSLKLQTQYFSFDGDLPGADDLDMFKLFLQPTLPFPLKNGKTLWVRPGVPFIFDQPVFDTDSRRLGSESGLGDITLDVQYGTTLVPDSPRTNESTKAKVFTKDGHDINNAGSLVFKVNIDIASARMLCH